MNAGTITTSDFPEPSMYIYPSNDPTQKVCLSTKDVLGVIDALTDSAHDTSPIKKYFTVEKDNFILSVGLMLAYSEQVPADYKGNFSAILPANWTPEGPWSAAEGSNTLQYGSFSIKSYSSPNIHSDRGRKLNGAVIHYTAGGYEGSVSWLVSPNSEVSAHYVVGRDGRIAQLCPLNYVAWHAGRSWGATNPNRYTVGYEVVATESDGYTYTDLQYEFLAQHLAWLFSSNGLVFQYPDNDPDSHRDSSSYWSSIFNNSRGFCIGHSAVNPHKDDPGSSFDWNRLKNLVSQYT
jgi:hypothetical protein